MKNAGSDRRLFLLTCCLVLSPFLSSCTSVAKIQGGDTFSSKAVLLAVPFVGQGDPTLCGLASLQMLARYYSHPLTPTLLKALNQEARQKKGIKGASLEGALKKAGYHAAIFSGTLDKGPKGLFHHLDLHRPLLVMLSPEGAKENHYQLVSGYDPERSLISILDPAQGPLVLPLSSFKVSWERAHSFTLLAVPLSKEEGTR